MDKKDYETIIAADPSVDLDELGLTGETRADAESFRAEMQALDQRIAAALSIDAPAPGMPELPPVGGDNVAALHKPRSRRLTPPAWIGLAAGFVLVAVLGGRFLTQESYPSLAAEIVAHLDHEPGALVRTTSPVAERSLARVVNRSDVAVSEGLGLVTYARSCVINGKTIPHLVIQGRNGPVTLLLMPEEKVESATPLEGESINGVILPVGEGSIAIIGERDEDLQRIQEQVVDSVSFSI